MLVRENYTHGGEVNKEITMDFSINVNPLGMPEHVRKSLLAAVDEVEKYPDATCKELVEKLSKHLTVPKEHLICGNGADELIYGYARVLKEYAHAKTVLIIAPAFGEYERALSAEGLNIQYLMVPNECGDNKDELDSNSGNFAWNEKWVKSELFPALEKADAVFVCSPSNPAGRLVERKFLNWIAMETKQRGKWCFFDFCFYELTEDYDTGFVASLVEENKNVAVVSAFTKTYAIPGARLGYLMCAHSEVITFLSKHTQCWNVSVFAQQAGIACLTSEGDAYVEEARRYISTERKFLRQNLEKMVAQVFSSEANYLLFYDSFPYAKKLREQGILIRDCSNYYGLKEGYARVAVRSHEENVKLLEAMEVCRGKEES